MGLGGPVWHASAASTGLPLGALTLERCARTALVGVGDPDAGEWTEWSGRAFHIRRRLSATEAEPVGPVVDVRGTPEGDRRWSACRLFLPAEMRTEMV